MGQEFKVSLSYLGQLHESLSKEQIENALTLLFKTLSLIDQASLELAMLLSQHPECWDDRYVPPCPALQMDFYKANTFRGVKSCLLPCAGSRHCAHLVDEETEALALTVISQGTGDT